MPQLSIKSTSQTELRLAHSFVGGWIFASIGAGIAWAGWNLVDAGVGRWAMSGMGLLFAAIGVGGGLWRFDLTIDLIARSYRGRRGFWPSPRSLHGSLGELSGVVLTRIWRRSKNSSHPAWVVSLEFAGWEKPVSVYETTSETEGHRKQEELARLLQASAVDRTGDTATVRAHDELDRAVADDRDETPQASGPPPETIERGIGELGGPMLVLPAAGVNIGTIFLALFALPFLGFGILALGSALGVSPIEVEGTLTAKWVVGLMFTLFGVLMEAGAVFGSVAREVVRDEGDSIVVSLRAFGRHYRRRELSKRRIEEIAVKDSRSERRTSEVVVRSDRRVVRLAGDRPAEDQRWLVGALLEMARR